LIVVVVMIMIPIVTMVMIVIVVVVMIMIATLVVVPPGHDERRAFPFLAAGTSLRPAGRPNQNRHGQEECADCGHP
jgi:hypothetical protein